MLFLFVFVIRHALCRQKLVCKSVGQSIRGMGDKEVNEGQHLPCCFYLRLLLDTLCIVRNCM